ncbi:MAG TPA: hypothetical protein VNA25_05015 [Phycisphaerae bacterium]|nr:hypothetical protein [Phycisphaerae bacterium]
MAESPTSRSLKLLRDQGYHAYVVEKWVPQARKRIDVGGFGDILAWKPNHGVLLVQTTTSGHLAERRTKIQTQCNEAARTWLQSCQGAEIHLHGWSKKGAAGTRKTWQCRVEVVNLEDLMSEGELFGSEGA